MSPSRALQVGPLSYAINGVSVVGLSDVKLAFVRGKAGYALGLAHAGSHVGTTSEARPHFYGVVGSRNGVERRRTGSSKSPHSGQAEAHETKA